MKAAVLHGKIMPLSKVHFDHNCHMEADLRTGWADPALVEKLIPMSNIIPI